MTISSLQAGAIITGIEKDKDYDNPVKVLVVQLRPNLYHLINMPSGITVWYHDEPKTIEDTIDFINNNIEITSIE